MTGAALAFIGIVILGFLRRRLPGSDADLLASLGIVEAHRQARRDS